jgi:hypothetical protein
MAAMFTVTQFDAEYSVLAGTNLQRMYPSIRALGLDDLVLGERVNSMSGLTQPNRARQIGLLAQKSGSGRTPTMRCWGPLDTAVAPSRNTSRLAFLCPQRHDRCARFRLFSETR